jgi:hypothetical protein
MVFMQHVAFEHVGNCLKATMGVGRKSSNVVVWVLCGKLIEH